jgi:hypothetical protein
MNLMENKYNMKQLYTSRRLEWSLSLSNWNQTQLKTFDVFTTTIELHLTMILHNTKGCYESFGQEKNSP